MKTAETLYVVADGGRARFLRMGERGHFGTFKTLESDDIHDRAHDMGRGPPARVQESSSPTRHGIEPRVNPRARVEREFAKLIGESVNTDPSLGDFDALVVAAPSRILSQLRAALSPVNAAKLVASLAKDLTKIPDPDLADHLPRPAPPGLKP